MKAMAVVIDTNIFVAAGFSPDSASGRVLERVRRGALRMVWNDETRAETEFIVNKIPPLSGSFPVNLFRTEHRFGGPVDRDAFLFVPDPDDRKFAALASAAGATLLTLDDHLLGEQSRIAVPVLTPGEYLERTDAERADGDESSGP